MVKAENHLGAHPVQPPLSFHDATGGATGGAAAALPQGARNAPRGARSSGRPPQGAPSTPSTTKSPTCISNASQTSHFFPFQLLPLKTISLDRLKFLTVKATYLPAPTPLLLWPGHSSWGLGPALPQPCPFPPSSRFCNIPPRHSVASDSSPPPSGLAENHPHLGKEVRGYCL